MRTLADMFDHAADRYPDRDVRAFFAEEALSFARLGRDGRVLARGLLAAGAEVGEPVAILMRSKLAFLRAVHGVTAAGGVLVPLSATLGFNERSVARLRHVIADSGVRRAIVDDAFAPLFARLLPRVTPLSLSALMRGDDRGPSAAADLPVVDQDELALVQYTSGSTANPKGVALTHRSVLAGIRAIHHGAAIQADDVVCLWLPLFHDMGLVSSLLAIGGGLNLRLSPQQDFIKHPDHWLRKAGEFGATILAGPNFFYRYLVDSIAREEAADYDLSSVRICLNGAEPIDPELISEFGRHFAASGLAPHAMTPCYGLAEATLAVTFSPVERAAPVDWVDRGLLNRTQRARAVGADAAGARGIVGCGGPVPGLEIRITQSGYALPERVVGEIEIRGEPVMRGYFRERSAVVSDDGWCPTGDLGYLADGCLYVTGRRKEMMILGGQNYYPQDIEEEVRQVPGIYRGNVVAVVLPPDPEAGVTERIGVLAEIHDGSPPYDATVSALRQAAAEALGGASVDVVLLRRNGLLRTTSGKFQRLSMRDRLLAGTLDRILVHVRAGESPPTGEPVGEPGAERRASSPA